MAIIYDRSDAYETDKVISLSNEQMARKLDISGSWNWIRIGMRWHISTSAAAYQPKMAFGLNSGTSSLYGSTPTTHFVGAVYESTTTTGYQVIGINYAPWGDNWKMLTTANNSKFARIRSKVGTTETTYETGDLGANQLYVMGCATGSGEKTSTVTFVDFVKGPDTGSPWLIRHYFPFANDASNIQTPVSKSSDFLNMMAEATSSIYGYWPFNNGFGSLRSYETQSYYVPVTESVNGVLDTITVYWRDPVYSLNISDIAAYRFT